jgi:glycosyltransferase involved in cell wall biosynthesis
LVDPTTRSAPPAILLVAEGGDAGGIGRYCVDLAGAIGARAGLLCLCPAPCGGVETCWLAAQCANRGIQLETVAMPAKAWRTGLTGLVRVWRRTGRPLLHVNGRRGNAVALVARLLNPAMRYVTTVHGVLGLHDRRNAVYRLVDLVAGRGASAVIAVSVDTQRRLLRAGSPRARTHVVLNALAEPDLARFREIADRRWAADRHDGPLRIGFLGRLSPEKGTRELLETAMALRTSGARMTVAIGGDGPDRDWMTEKANALIEEGLLRFHCEVPDSARFLGDLDVLVIPSRNEGLPYVLLEAMAAGCAVVAFGVGGIPEVVTDPSLGILVRQGDVQALSAALRRLDDDRTLVVSLGRAGSNHIANQYALSRRLPLLSSVYGIDVVPPRTRVDASPGDRPG